jgi:hypothetical protein
MDVEKSRGQNAAGVVEIECLWGKIGVKTGRNGGYLAVVDYDDRVVKEAGSVPKGFRSQHSAHSDDYCSRLRGYFEQKGRLFGFKRVKIGCFVYW